MSLSEAVNSICGPEVSTNHNYMNMEPDLLYMDQAVSSNILDSGVHYNKDSDIGNETITSSYNQSTSAGSVLDTSNEISSAMSQYVNALKKAGLPTDLPILFESGDGSYINVNEQVLLDMVQSSEIQYEVIEQPNIIEKVANPTEIKSIDELSKSIERGEMLINTKCYSSDNNYDKDSSEYIRQDEAINSLNAILPDNLESISEQQNYVVLNSVPENNHEMDHITTPDFSCIVNDMHFFTKSINDDDSKNYYEDQSLNIARTIEQMTLPTSTGLDTNFNMSFLDTKVSSHFEHDGIGHEYHPLTTGDLRRNDDGYDFSLQLSQNNDFKDDTLDCLISNSKTLDTDYNKHEEYNEPSQLELNNPLEETTNTRLDLQNTENVLPENDYVTSINKSVRSKSDITELSENLQSDIDFNENLNEIKHDSSPQMKSIDNTFSSISSSTQYSNISTRDNTNNCEDYEKSFNNHNELIDLNEDKVDVNVEKNKEMLINNEDNVSSTLEENIPFAVGLLPLSKVSSTDCITKRKNDSDLNQEVNCLKRKVKHKKL